MEMRKMEELKDKLMRDLDTISNKNALTVNDVDLIKKLTGSIKNIGKIMEMEEQGSSNAGYSNRHHVRGHYSRDGGSYGGSYAENSYDGGSYGESYGRGSYGSYAENSYGGGMKEMLEKEYRNARDEREKEVIRRLMDKM